jgi:hypothetical protein
VNKGPTISRATQAQRVVARPSSQPLVRSAVTGQFTRPSPVSPSPGMQPRPSVTPRPNTPTAASSVTGAYVKPAATTHPSK